MMMAVSERSKWKKLRLKFLLLMIIFLSTPIRSFADKELRPEVEKKGAELRLEVIKAKLNEKGDLLDIQFRIRGVGGRSNIPPEYFKDAYVIEESTKEKFNVRGFARVGVLGQKRLGEGPISFARIDNAGMKIRKDSRITFVIGELRQEHIIVEE